MFCVCDRKLGVIWEIWRFVGSGVGLDVLERVEVEVDCRWVEEFEGVGLERYGLSLCF